MESKKLLLVLLCGAGLLNFSCSPYNRLAKNFNRDKTSIQYLFTSNTETAKNGASISVAKPVITDRTFPKIGEVSKVKNHFLPLLVYTEWRHEYQCKVGRLQLNEDLAPFVQSAFIEESKRSGTFEADTTHSDLRLEIEIDSIGASGPYQNSGMFLYLFFGYAYQVQETAGPGSAYCRFHYTVKRGDQVLLEDYITNRASFNLLQAKQATMKKFHGFYRANLIESMGETIKKNIEELVTHVNILFEDAALRE